MKSNIGLIGLAVMGQNLVLNMESKGYRVSAYNRTEKRAKAFMSGPAAGKDRITAYYTLEDFVESLEKPRKIMLMVKAGQPVDEMIDELVPLLDKGDIIIDGGNSFLRIPSVELKTWNKEEFFIWVQEFRRRRRSTQRAQYHAWWEQRSLGSGRKNTGGYFSEG